MSVQGRIQELSNRHRDLDTEIEHEEKRPARDTLRLASMKRQKLRIKEELASLGARSA